MKRIQTRIAAYTVFFLSLTSTTSGSSPTLESRAEAYFHFILGTVSGLAGQPGNASQHFARAATLDPTSSFIKLKQAEQFLEIGNDSEAKTLLLQIQSTEDKNPEYHLLMARLESQSNHLDGSLKALERATQLFLQNKQMSKARETMLTRVALLADHKRHGESVNALEKYLKAQPDDEIAHYFLGKIQSIFMNRVQAKKSYEKALKIRPNFLAAAKALGLLLELEGKIPEALATYQRANRFSSNDEELLQKLINLSLIGEDYMSALDYLTQYLMVRPDDQQAELRTALIHYKLKHYDQAKFLFEDLIATESPSKDRIYFYLGSLHEEKAEYLKAIENYEKIPASSEYFVESRLQIASVLSDRMEKNELAVQSLNEAIALKGDSPELQLGLAGIHEKSKHLTEAIRVLTRASENFLNNEKVLFMLGTVLDRAGDYQSGIDRMRDVLRINPNNPHALNHIGYSYAERKINLAEAESLLKKAVQLAPDNGFILDSLGWVHYQQGEYKKAAKVLNRANQLAPDQAVILEHLADTYQKLGMKKEALAMYRSIMQLSAKAKVPEHEAVSTNTGSPTAQSVQDRVREKLASLSGGATY